MTTPDEFRRVFRAACAGELPLTLGEDPDRYCGVVDYEVAGWRFGVFWDCGDWDYIDYVTTPEGRRYELWDEPHHGLGGPDEWGELVDLWPECDEATEAPTRSCAAGRLATGPASRRRATAAGSPRRRPTSTSEASRDRSRPTHGRPVRVPRAATPTHTRSQADDRR